MVLHPVGSQAGRLPPLQAAVPPLHRPASPEGPRKRTSRKRLSESLAAQNIWALHNHMDSSDSPDVE